MATSFRSFSSSVVSGLLVVWCAGGLAPEFAQATDAKPRVPVEPFFRHADYGEFKLSPSGKYVAGLVPVGGRSGLVTIELTTRKPGPPTTIRESDVVWFDWVNEERLVFTAIDRRVGGGFQRGLAFYTVQPDGSGFKVLTTEAYRHQVLATLHDGSDAIVVALNRPNPRFPDVYRMNAQTGTLTLLTLG